MVIPVPKSHPSLSLADIESYDPHGGRGPDHGKRYRCPICGDGERSLSVNINNGLYNCKRGSCGVTGKLSEFWDNGPKPTRAARVQSVLQRAFGAASDEASTPAPLTAVPASDDWKLYACGAKPLEDSPAADYLASRGITCGLLPVVARGCLYHSAFLGRPAVLFPMRDRRGEAVAIQARMIDGKPKPHRAVGPKSAGVFFTRPEIWQAPAIVVVEAPVDALSLMACGVPAVALGGTDAPEWLPGACGFRCAVVATDADENRAGDHGAEKLAPALASFGAKVARLRPEIAPGEHKGDWNAMLQRHGIDGLSAWLHARLAHLAVYSFGQPATAPGQWWPFAHFSTP
jgi:hypothetical protein